MPKGIGFKKWLKKLWSAGWYVRIRGLHNKEAVEIFKWGPWNDTLTDQELAKTVEEALKNICERLEL